LTRHSAVIQKYQALGIEFAVHGLVHVDHTRLSLDEQQAHFKRAQQLFKESGVRASGFRCPYLRWNVDTVTALSDYGFAYDSSQALAWDVVNGLETEAYRHVLDFYRSQAAVDYPALPHLVGDIVRIPYCVPDDEALVERLQLTDDQAMAEIWIEMLKRIYEAGELFTVGLHPERAALCLIPLQTVLAKARALSPAVWIARLDEIATWWRKLRQATFAVIQQGDDRFQLAVEAPPEAVILIRAVEVEASTQPGPGGYQRVLANPFFFQANKRPFIGLGPDSPPALLDFLRQQGYLAEISLEAQAYSFYLDRSRFFPEDERQLLIEIEKGAWPLIRLARWPDGAQSALSVTGDIDAFTLWDYGLRIRGN
jgi:hypothetical protein